MEETFQNKYASPGMKYHHIVVTRHGGPDVLQVMQEDLPEPQVGEVRVKVLTAGVSAYDLMIRQFSFPGDPSVPFTLGEDIVGIMDKLGEGVLTIETGQRIAGYPRGGGYAEYVCLPVVDVVPVPEGVDSAEAVCLVANYLTAHMLLHRTAAVQSGDSILVHGAAGGTGTALLELGKLAGLEMYGTASKHNHELVSALGATPIDYREEDFVKSTRSHTEDGVDVMFDPIGGARQILRSYRALRKGGRLVSYGMAATSKSGLRSIPLTLLMVVLLGLMPDGKQASMSPNLTEVASEHNNWYRETLSELLDLLAKGKLKPLVAERVPMLEAVRAHELLERGGYAGKVVLVAVA